MPDLRRSNKLPHSRPDLRRLRAEALYRRAADQRGGRVAGNARKELEREMGRPVISAENAKTMKLVTDIIEDAAKLPGKVEDER